MTEQIIDFTQSTKRVVVNPIVPLAVLDVFCRTNDRVQGTILGKIYSSYIEVVEFIPLLVENYKIDWSDHQKKVESLQSIYPNLEVLGGLLTDLKDIGNQIPIIHTLYTNKESGFKAQGLLTTGLVMSVGTDLSKGQFVIKAYTYNSAYKFCQQLLGITAFEEWNVKISFGNTKIQQVSPIYTSLQDQQQFLPTVDIRNVVVNLLKNLNLIKAHVKKIIKGEEPSDNHLGLSLKKILALNNLQKSDVSRHAHKSASDMKLIVYLSNVVNTQNLLADKLNKLG